MNYEFEEKVRKAIVRTIAYFDMFQYPLTDFEVWKYLSVKCDLLGVKKILTSMSLRGGPAVEAGTTKQSRQDALTEIASPRKGGARNDKVLETKNGFYSLASRSEIIKTRLARYNFTNRKFRRALRIAKLFKFIPWLKMIVVGNMMGAHNLKDESDIDLFVITETGRIWLARFFCAGITKILGLRPDGKNARDKICLNFYVSEEEVDLRKFMLDDRDIYFIYWLANLIMIYDKDEMYNKFVQANKWLNNYLPNWQAIEISDRWKANTRKNFLAFFVNILFSPFERLAKKIQIKMLPKNLKELANIDARVVINDKVLKLHANDRREEYRKRWEEKIDTNLSSRA